MDGRVSESTRGDLQRLWELLRCIAIWRVHLPQFPHLLDGMTVKNILFPQDGVGFGLAPSFQVASRATEAFWHCLEPWRAEPRSTLLLWAVCLGLVPVTPGQSLLPLSTWPPSERVLPCSFK